MSFLLLEHSLPPQFTLIDLTHYQFCCLHLLIILIRTLVVVRFMECLQSPNVSYYNLTHTSFTVGATVCGRNFLCPTLQIGKLRNNLYCTLSEYSQYLEFNLVVPLIMQWLGNTLWSQSFLGKLLNLSFVCNI